MATYIYETIPSKKGQKVKTYEIKQSMKDAPLKKHPETGEPIQRVMAGGYGIMGGTKGKSKRGGHCQYESQCQSHGGGGCCGGGSCGPIATIDLPHPAKTGFVFICA